jgi:hypothetical protein
MGFHKKAALFGGGRISCKLAMNYMMSIALAKNVTWKGRIRVRYSQWAQMANTSRAEEARNNNQ